ncbi:hypothetical protein [Georgenia sp. SUBG003]|uniref:hypothetical protein n=1 Tax=Georgenia sp. SUBG003 TaxID=1497974 RepID=UPI003AB32EF9
MPSSPSYGMTRTPGTGAAGDRGHPEFVLRVRPAGRPPYPTDVARGRPDVARARPPRGKRERTRGRCGRPAGRPGLRAAASRLDALIPLAAAHRAAVDPDLDDIVDPYRRELSLYRESFDQILPAVRTIAQIALRL